MPVLGSPVLMARSRRARSARFGWSDSGRRRSGGDDGREVVRPERLDGGRGNLPRHERGLLNGNRAVHQDNHQSPVLLAHLVRGDVRRHLCGPHRLGRTRARGELHRRERADGCRDTVVEHGEIRGSQPAHRLPLVVQDRHIELDELDARSKLRQVALALREKADGRQDLEADQADSTHTHRYSSRGRPRWFCGSSAG